MREVDEIEVDLGVPLRRYRVDSWGSRMNFSRSMTVTSQGFAWVDANVYFGCAKSDYIPPLNVSV